MNKYMGLLLIVALLIVFWVGVGYGRYVISPEPTVITENSKFVVKKVDGEQGNWNYTLENINLENSNELRTLIIQTTRPYGYKLDDTLQVLNYNRPKLNIKLQ